MSQHWFPAKHYGWGWGLPITWQGWLVFAAFFVLLLAGLFVFPPQENPGAFIIYVVVLSAVLVVICWWKGEPPHWRWG